MKFIICILITLVTSKLTAGNKGYDDAIRRFDSDPSAKNMLELAGHLRGVARYNQPPETSPYYHEIQQRILAIPGHARYFANKIKREQEKVAGYPTITGPRVTYDFNRTMHFETLSHLPSPETIAVLGDFLSDDIDTPQPLVSPDSDWGENPRANSFGASATIMRMDLRNPPVTFDQRNDDPDQRLAKTRAWWEEIKSGSKAFSFRGQSVEYRFKPDGTWETLAMANPPDDAPKPVAAAKPARNSQSPPVAVKPPPGNSWPWIIGAAMIGLALVVWLGLRQSPPDP